jgi:hypothetical protein
MLTLSLVRVSLTSNLRRDLWDADAPLAPPDESFKSSTVLQDVHQPALVKFLPPAFATLFDFTTSGADSPPCTPTPVASEAPEVRDLLPETETGPDGAAARASLVASASLTPSKRSAPSTPGSGRRAARTKVDSGPLPPVRQGPCECVCARHTRSCASHAPR